MLELATVTGPTTALDDALKDVPPGAGFRVVNILKFHTVAIYPSEYSGPSVAGKEAYWNLYIAGMAPIATAEGVSLFLRARAFGTIAGLQGEEWDEIAIFEWPSVETMKRLSVHPKFLELSIHRIAATKDLRMIPMEITSG